MGEEDRIQQECYMWFHNNLRHLRGLLFSIPNGGKRDPITAKILKSTGLVPGVSDMMFIFDSKAYCLECKTENGRQSNVQKIWEYNVTGGFGKAYYKIFRNLEEFKVIIYEIIK